MKVQRRQIGVCLGYRCRTRCYNPFLGRYFASLSRLVIVTDSNRTVLVFWGQGFNEIAASIFVGELRRLGMRVKLVGLNSRQIAGQHGLTLVPDWTLGQALDLADQVKCIVIPAPLAALQQFSYDPRLAELLQVVVSCQALLVVDCRQIASPLFPSPYHALEYPSLETLVPFVQAVLWPRLIVDT
jgi:hypothetical protein